MYRILIVEDESEMRSLLVGYIRRSQPDLEVVGSAVNGKEALQLAEERHPDIVITDIAMPIMDGLVFLQEAAQRGLPFKTIIISGYDEFAYAKKAVALGVSEYLLKPFDPMELETVLNKIKDDLNKQQILLDNMELLQEKVEEGASLLKAHTLRAVLEGREEKRPTNEILDTSADYYCICLLKLPFYMGSERWNTQKQENVDELVTLLSASCLPKEIRAQGLNMAGNGVILALFGSAEVFPCGQKRHGAPSKKYGPILRNPRRLYYRRRVRHLGAVEGFLPGGAGSLAQIDVHRPDADRLRAGTA